MGATTARDLAREFARVVREAGPMSATTTLLRAADEVVSWAEASTLDVELLLGSGLSATEATALAAALAPGFPADAVRTVALRPVGVEVPADTGPGLRARVRALLGSGAPHRAGDPRPSVLVVAAGDATLDEDALDQVQRAATERPLVLLAGSTPQPLATLAARLGHGPWRMESLDLSAAPAPPLTTRFATAPWADARPTMTAAAAATALDELTQALHLAIDGELRDLKVKRTIAAQRGQRQPVARPAGSSEGSSEVKGRLQRQFAEFERGAAERLQDLLAVPGGRLAEEIERALAGLTDLQTEARQSTLSARVPEAFEAELNRLIRERIARHFVADATILNDFLGVVARDLERHVAQATGSELVVQLEHLTDERVRRVMGLAGTLQSAYRTELPSTGIAEYVSAVRRGPMMFFMMMALVFGSAFMSQVRRAMEVYVPLVLVLIAGTLYGYHYSAQKQVAEALAKGLEDARQSLRGELKRLFSEIQKQWSAVLSQHLAEQLTLAQSQVESLLREPGRRPAEAGLDKERAQRQVQQLDQAEKRLLAADKAREAVASAITQWRAELRRQGTAVARPAPAAPPPARTTAVPATAAPAAPAAVARPALPPRPALAPRERPALPPREKPQLPRRPV